MFKYLFDCVLNQDEDSLVLVEYNLQLVLKWNCLLQVFDIFVPDVPLDIVLSVFISLIDLSFVFLLFTSFSDKGITYLTPYLVTLILDLLE